MEKIFSPCKIFFFALLTFNLWGAANQEVEVTELSLIAEPTKAQFNHRTQEIAPLTVTRAVETIMATCKKLTDHTLPKLKATPSQDNGVSYSGKNETLYLFCVINQHNQIEFLSLTQKTPPLEGNTKGTKAAFESYARSVYQIVFDEEPIGKTRYRHDGTGIMERQDEGIFWDATIQTVHFPVLARVNLTKKKNEWTLQLSKGCTQSDRKEINKILKKKPITLTEEEAKTIALEAETLLGIAHEGDDTMLQVETSRHSFRPNPAQPENFHLPRLKQWQPKNDPSPDLRKPHYCTKVTHSKGLIQNEFFIDWHTRKILHVNHFKASW